MFKDNNNGIFRFHLLILIVFLFFPLSGYPAGGGVERALPALCHPVVSPPGQLPTALPARPLSRHAGQNQLHQPRPAPPTGDLQPLQGPGCRSHRVCLPQGRRAVQTRSGPKQTAFKDLRLGQKRGSFNTCSPFPNRDSRFEGSRTGWEPPGSVSSHAGTTHPLTLPHSTSQVTSYPHNCSESFVCNCKI